MNRVDKTIIEWFNSDFGTNFSDGLFGNICLILVSLLFAAFFAGIIGYERETNGHNAGFRTHILVAVGSAIVMILSLYGFPSFDEQNAGVRDPARLAAQVVSGIGFLGAGAIIKSGFSVRGLTTATTLWVSMAIGLAAGSGCFCIAALGTLVAVVALVSMRRVEKAAAKKNPYIVLVYDYTKGSMKEILEISSEFGVTIHETSTELIEVDGETRVRLSFKIASADPKMVNAFCDELRIKLQPYEFSVSSDS